MPQASLLGHMHGGAGEHGPAPAVEGSPDVFIGGAPVLRVGDHFADGSVVTEGAPHVFINGRPAARRGDPVSNGATVTQGCPRVRIGNCGGPEYGRRMLFKSLTDPHDKLIACLPEMAARTCEEANERDKPGWIILHEAAVKWLEGSAYKFSNDEEGKLDNGPVEPVWAEWFWLMRYERFYNTAAELLKPEYLFSLGARDKLCAILMAEGCFEGKGKPFTFITPRQNWRNWREHAFQGCPMDTWKIEMINISPLDVLVDGLAILANVTIYALADGQTVRLPEGWRVYVNRVAFFIHDGFDFSGEDQTLGYWNCDENFTGFSLLRGIELRNRHFNDFRTRTGYGQDLRITCEPEVVRQEEFYYDVSS